VVLSKVAILWDVAPCSSYANCRFRGMYDPHLQGWKIREQETSGLDVATQNARSVCSSETSTRIWTTRNFIPEVDNIQSNSGYGLSSPNLK
jgi:hypothetical protein